MPTLIWQISPILAASGFPAKKLNPVRRSSKDLHPTIRKNTISAKMAGIKRKEAPAAKTNVKGSPKKAKTVPSKPTKARIPPPDLEAETDSDPIVESDTTDHSGDDDGASWPSGDEHDGGVAISTAKLQVSEPKAAAKDNGNGKLPRKPHYGRYHLMPM